MQIKKRSLNKKNQTPLHIAAKYDSTHIGKLLISAGANINAKDIIYQIIVKIFLIMNIHLKERCLNKKNQTPLHISTMNKSDKIGEILISKGADLNAKDIICQITKKHF